MAAVSREQAPRSTRRRRAILDAAVALFATQGFAATTTSAVAEAAGVGHGTVFLHYSSKEALFQAAVLEPLAEIERLFRLVPKPDVPVIPQLRAMVKRQVAVVARREDYLRLVLYVLGQQERFPLLARRLNEFAKRSATSLASMVALGQRGGELAAGDPSLVALSYFAYLQGLAITLRLPPRHPAWDAMAAGGLRLFAPVEHPRPRVT